MAPLSRPFPDLPQNDIDARASRILCIQFIFSFIVFLNEFKFGRLDILI